MSRLMAAALMSGGAHTQLERRAGDAPVSPLADLRRPPLRWADLSSNAHAGTCECQLGGLGTVRYVSPSVNVGVGGYGGVGGVVVSDKVCERVCVCVCVCVCVRACVSDCACVRACM